MKKQFMVFVISLLLTVLPAFPCFAGQWQQDEIGWRYQEDDGSYVVNRWQWIDGNGDGVCESYCFDESGYAYINTVTPDGYQVNEAGAWVENGTVQTQRGSSEITASYPSDSSAHSLVGKWEEKSYGNTSYGSYGAPYLYQMLEISKQDNGTLKVLGWAREKESDEWSRYRYLDKVLSPVGDGVYMGPDQSGYNLTEDMYFYAEGDNLVTWYTNQYTTIYALYERLR